MAEVQPDICIYRLMSPAEFADFKESGRFEGAVHDRADGFIHFSRAGQVRETARLHYGDAEEIVLVEVATAPLIDFVRWEESHSGRGGGELFPHLYGVLDWGSVRRSWELERPFAWPESVPE